MNKYTILLLIGFALCAAHGFCDSEDDFLNEAHKLQAQKPNAATSGTLPPSTMDPSMVPVIALDTSDLDLGELSYTDFGHGKVTISNHGKAALRITDIKTSCHCTEGKMKDAEPLIPPGGSSDMEVTVDPKRMGGFTSKKVLSISSNDPKNPVVTVNVSAHVKPEFELDPPKLELGKIEKGKAVPFSVRFRQLQDAPIENISIEIMGYKGGDTGGAAMEAEVVPVPEDKWKSPGKHEFDIKGSVTADAPAGEFSRQLSIATGVERLPWYRYSITATVATFYTVDQPYPRRVMLKQNLATGRNEGTLAIKADRPITVTLGEYDKDKLEAVVRPDKDPDNAFIDIATAPTAPVGRLDEEVAFTVKGDGEEVSDRLAARAVVSRSAESK